MLAFLVQLLPFLVLLLQAFMDMRDEAKAANKQFVLDQATFHAAIDRAKAAQVARAAKDSAGASSGWDQADKDLKP